jgi:hypothetical protein
MRTRLSVTLNVHRLVLLENTRRDATAQLAELN